MSKIQCQSCSNASLTFDNYMDLSIPIPKSTGSSKYGKFMSSNGGGKISLEDCLEAFISDESMEKCGYKCSKCKEEDVCKKQMTIWRFPKVMVIHLKRF